MTNDVEALLFDFGGVLVGIDFDRVCACWARHAGVDAARVRSRFTHGRAYMRHETGEIDAARYYAAVRKELGLPLTDAQLAEGWAEVFVGEIEETVGLVREVAGRIPVYLFSNTNRAHFDVWSSRYAAALAPFRRMFVSCALGRRKPDPDAFLQVAQEIGVPPRRILFFDDTLSNVEGARSAGMHAVHVRSPQDVRAALGPWLGPGPQGRQK